MHVVELRERFIAPLMRKSTRRYDWNKFNPDRYHEHNYQQIDPVDEEVLGELIKFYKEKRPSGLFLEVGAGSNMYPILAALPYADQIDVCEYGAQNIAYLRKQVKELDPSWQKWIDRLVALAPEVYGQVNFQQQLQQKMRVVQGSIFALPTQVYDNISMHGVAESLTQRDREFKKAVKCFTASAKPGATLVAIFVKNSSGYDTPGRQFPAIAIEAWDAVKIFGPSMQSLRFGSTNAEIRPGSPLITAMGQKK